LAQDSEKEREGLKDVTLGRSEVIAHRPLEIGNAAAANVPATLPVPSPARTRRRWGRIALLVVMLATAAAGSYYWWKNSQDELPQGIVSGNGRIEADEIDVATKFAGRVAELRVEEGDMVSAGEVVARMDTRDLEASLKRAEAHVLQAQRAVDEARATEDQQRAQVALAKQQFDRTSYLMQRGNSTQELLDQRRQQLDGATASLNAATARIAQTEHALAAAEHEVELLTVNISDNSLVAPRDGRVQYRVARIGEVLPAGGKVLTLIDISYVYMDIYLPTLDAGQAKVGTEALIVLDAYPNIAIPAKVSFIATQSQFTPKTVETQTERDRLMFRIRVRIDPALLREHAQAVRSGLPGVTYVRLDPKAQWPARLQRTVGS
jgi:HlyD family secretion protein